MTISEIVMQHIRLGIRLIMSLAIVLVWADLSVSKTPVQTPIGLRVNAIGSVDLASADETRVPKPIKRGVFVFAETINPKRDVKDSDGDGVPDYLDRNPNFAGALSAYVYRVPFKGKTYVFRLNVAPDYTDVYRSHMSHDLDPKGQNVSSFVVKNEPYVAELVKQAKEYAKKDAAVSAQDLLVALVQNLPYNSDAYTGKLEYPKYPIETLSDQSGDCEDLSILAVNLLGELKGYDTVGFVFYGDHMALGLKAGEADVKDRKLAASIIKYKEMLYVYQEVTDPVWVKGQIPEAFKKRTAIVYTVS